MTRADVKLAAMVVALAVGVGVAARETSQTAAPSNVCAFAGPQYVPVQVSGGIVCKVRAVRSPM